MGKKQSCTILIVAPRCWFWSIIKQNQLRNDWLEHAKTHTRQTPNQFDICCTSTLCRAQAPCTAAIRTARNIVQDLGKEVSARSHGLLKLAHCRPDHSERDSRRVLVNQLGLSLPIPISQLDTGCGSKLPVLKLEDWAQFLVNNGCWHMLCGLVRPDKVREERIWTAFWKNYESQNPAHPIFDMARRGQLSLARTAAIVAHGDEGRGKRRTPFLVLSYHSVLGRGLHPQERVAGGVRKYLKLKPNYIGHTYTSRFLTACCPKSMYTNANENTFTALMDFVADQAVRMSDAGVTDHGGVRYNMMLLHIVGDWPYLQKSGQMKRSFSNVQKHVNHRADYVPAGVCHLCLAGTDGVPYEIIATRRPAWMATMHMESPFTSDPPYLRVPHNIAEPEKMWAFDLFHAFHLGMGKDFLGSGLAILSDYEVAGNVDERFELLTARYLSWCASKALPAYLTTISKHSLKWPSRANFPTGSWHKGDLTKVLMLFFEDQCITRAAEFAADRMLILAGEAATAVNICLGRLYRADAFLEREDAVEIGEYGLRFLRRYQELASLASAASRSLWVIQPKAHVLHHWFCFMALCQSAKLLNPMCVACQANEDFIGRPSRLSRKICAGKLTVQRVIERYLQSCFHHWVKEGLVRK